MDPDPYLPDAKRPRQYAAEILDRPEADRPAALAKVPEPLRDWVRSYVHRGSGAGPIRKRLKKEPTP